MKRKNLAKMAIGLALTMGLLAGCGVASRGSTSAGSNTNETSDAQTEASTSETETASAEANTAEVTTIEETTESEEMVGTSSTLVVYYSAQGHTAGVAQAIAEELGADVFVITPVEEYTEEDLDWTTNGSRVNLEHEDESLQDIELVTTQVENWESYDTVYIGYPIWWGNAAWPVNNFVKENDFTGKTVIPFCTSSSSGIGRSGELLEEMTGTGDWQEGQRFSGSAVDEAREWARSLSQ